MSRPLPALLVFLAISFTIVSLAQGVEIPTQGKEVQLGSNQTTVEREAEDISTIEGTIDTISCIGSLGLTELDILGNTCSDSATFLGDTGGVFSIVRSVTSGLGEFVSLLGSLMTFNVPGAPDWLRWAIGTPIMGTTAYIVISLLRGAG